MVAAAEAMPVQSDTSGSPVKLAVQDLTIRYDGTPALSGVNLTIREHEIFGIIGPANAGKTSFLKTLNRMDDFNSIMKVGGTVTFSGRDIRDWRNVYALRSRIGVVFALPVGYTITFSAINSDLWEGLDPETQAMLTEAFGRMEDEGWANARENDAMGVALISGTGSFAFGRNAGGDTARVGGWGFRFGDEGSGYALAVAGLRAACRWADGRGPAASPATTS